MSSVSNESRRPSTEPVDDLREIHDHLLKHIVLPRVLPDKNPEMDDEHEPYLMNKLLDTMKHCHELIPKQTLKAMEQFKQTHNNRTSSEFISKQIKSLEPGDTFSMLIENQKCVFMIHVPDVEQNAKKTSFVQIATFPSCVVLNEMYKSNFHFTYPAQTLDVKFSELLCSKEFADQLCRLCTAKPPTKRSKIAYPNEVSVWLTAALRQWADKEIATIGMPTVTKKIRDEAIGKKDKKRRAALEYWHRSHLYMAMKVLLQLNLTIQMGDAKANEAKLIYKAVMLQFCTQMSAEYENPLFCPVLNIDLMTELLAKMARRIEKLSQFAVEGDMSNIVSGVIDAAKINISKIRERIDDQIKKLQDEFNGKNVLKPLQNLNFEADIDQQIPKLRKYLDERKESREDNIIHTSNRIEDFMREKFSPEQPPLLDFLEKCRNPEEKYINMTETEFWYLYVLELTDNRWSCADLRKHYNKYAKLSNKFHCDDPLAMTRMLLIRLKLLAVIDRKATTTYPMLLKHESGVNTDVFDVLLLPHSIDMKIAYDLQTYFNERNQKAKYPSLIGEKSISSVSFSVRFCADNANFSKEIEIIRQAIKVADEQKFARMKDEWAQQRQEAQNLRLKASASTCKLESSILSTVAMQRHRTNCNKCQFNHKIDSLMLTQYKPTLPDGAHQQNAILFELLIPDEIAILRDVLQITNKFGQNGTNKLNIKQNWISREILKTFSKSQSENVFLSSTGSVEPMEYQIGEHDDFAKLIAKNECNCIFHEEGMELNAIMKEDVIKDMFTLIVEPGSPYAELQWTMKSHFQNEVLARQSECSENLSLSEFKEFGSLRADGHRLQIRKLYTMIETEALSFDQNSVLSLILQTIWESGKCGESGYVRETHEDLADSVFVIAMIELLEKFVQQYKQNWAHPNKLLVVVFIVVRIFELNENERILNRLMILLHELRAILAEWLGKIQELLHTTIERNQKSEKTLRHSLAIVSIALAVTFFVNSNHPYFGKIFERNPKNGFTAPRLWILAIIKLYNNALINNNQKNTNETNLAMLIRIVRNTGIQCETMIRELTIDSSDDIFEVIKQQWSEAKRGKIKTFGFSESCLQSLDFDIEFNENRIDKVSIDIVTGAFLVNFLSVDQLPQHIISDPNHKRVFGEYVFEVQPNPSNFFTTVQKFNGCNYVFSWWNDSSITTECRVDDDTMENIEYELIPIKWLIDDIPMFLIENHSHWWNQEKNVIEIRPQQWNHEHFTKECGVEYTLDLNTNRLMQMKTNRPMLDIKSDSYRTILGYLSRLEDPEYIHVSIESKLGQNYHDKAIIELVRMNLKFIIDTTMDYDDGTFEMDSNEFNDMYVSRTQNCQTLFGLSHGLLLECAPDDDRKVLIVPHGDVQSAFTYSHVSVNINLKSELRNPPFHRYQVDTVLRQLKPSNSNFSAWFYLAYLHAITSHGEIEPLTGMSGTERALQILQSTFVWSSAPYDNEAVKTLQLIANLTPNRSLIDNKIQKIEWPKDILEHCAQDSYFFIVEKLIRDSQRLSELHFRSDKFELKRLSNPNLNRRDYFRCLQLRPNLRVDDTFMGHELNSKPLHSPSMNYSKSLKMVSALYHANSFKIPRNFKLKVFLTNTTNLCGPKYLEYVCKYFESNARLRFVDLWISFYEIARTERLSSNHFALILSLLVHEGDKNILPLILILQAVDNNPMAFRSIKAPKIQEYPQPNDLFNITEVEEIINSCSRKRTKSTDKAWTGYINNRIMHETNKLKNFVQDRWPCKKIDFGTIGLINNNTCVSIEEATTKLNERLSTWYKNRCLHQFIDAVVAQLKCLVPTVKIKEADLVVIPKSLTVQQPQPKYQINFAEKMIQHLNDCPQLEEAKKVWNMEMISDRPTTEWQNIYENSVRSVHDKHLVDAGLFPRLVPTIILPLIANEQTHPNLKAVIGCCALGIARDQHKRRIEDCAEQTNPDPNIDQNNEDDEDSANGSQEDMDIDMDESEMNHESQANVSQPGKALTNMAHANWKPCDYPEWLLFEIERDLTIRRIQIEVAKRMINPPDIGTKHSVMQLNMGEGKTAVIVPIVASVLANGEQACQIIVLKSLFATNLNSLRQYLGGMLNRRIYIFPCRRDMPIAECVTKLLDIYEECKKMKGVILTLPEYVLSFQLKIYESVQKENLAAAATFLTVHKWINANVRNIMDESDAILQAKYQLIYTVGNQLALDGGINRWIVTQAVLKRVPHHMKSLYDKYEGRKIEYDSTYMQSGQVSHRTDVFTPCRILDETVYDELSQLLVEDFIKGLLEITFPEMNAAAKDIVRLFLLEKNNNSEMLNGVKGEFTTVHMDILMILNGLLQFNLLKLVLTRRWRVNYGVKENGQRKMAIPFKAKDVATEMTEFGHPDVAICFTQLSYYYSGLSDEQLYRVFEILKANPNATGIYDKWIDSIPKKLIEKSDIQLYSKVNLEDPVQRKEQLFPLLRYNMYVIDYWLSLDVYPREAKTFEKKLKCTAWDLCSDRLQHRVTGFSGTNDTKNILPLPVAQNDLQELEQTNEKVRQFLLKRENENYVDLPANVSGAAIIRKLVEHKIRVLLDAGALMLEFSNKQTSMEWLNSEPNCVAAIYFDVNDILQSIDRNGTVVEFDCSVYRDDLSHCLVYIDDVHTRGTDLKFPLGWKACVTLSGDITRDKTVQACMRMRHLEKGHTISFWASHEADIRIRKICKLKSVSDSILNEHIIQFISKNSQCFEMQNTIHWATAAHNYTKKLAGHKLFENCPNEAVSLTNLYESIVDNELATLENLYGKKDQVKLIELVAQKFDELLQTFEPHNQIVEFIQATKKDILVKMNSKNAPCVWQSLDEEQEKELEREFEVHRHVERRTLMIPREPNIDENLLNYFNGIGNANDSLVHISAGLDNTLLFEPFKNEIEAWSSNLFVTKDFKNVLNIDSESCDDFLRPVWWIAGLKVDNGIQWIILSSFECECLMPTFRKSKIATLFMYRPRISRFHDNFLHNDRLKVTGMVKPLSINLEIEIQIGVYGGSMFFRTDTEQKAFCGFLGLIPRPRTNELEEAFKNGIIKPNGFVSAANRNLELLKEYVGNCKFDQNPAGLAIKLIVAQRQFMRKESHVASIVDRGIKLQVENAQDEVMDWQEIAQQQKLGKRPIKRIRKNSKRPRL